MAFRSVVLLGLILTGINGYSQDKKKTSRPDIPGSVIVELGVNLKNGIVPPDFKKGLWGSRTINVYYQYPIRIFKTKFSFNPGIGLSLERWRFINNYTLSPTPDADGSYPLMPATKVLPGTIDRTQLVNNYVEAPLEIRYDTTPEDIARSFNACLGVRVGVLYDSFMKIDYRENGENRTNKDKQFHGMNPIRYGVYGRIGIGGFSLFSYYNLSPMFQTDKGPVNTSMNSVTIGISINGF